MRKPINIDPVIQLFIEDEELTTDSIPNISTEIFCEKAKEYNIKPFYAQRIISAVQTAYKSKIFDDNSSDESDYADYSECVYVQEPMPTYMNRAIWYRLDDENLERLVDQSVKKVLNMKQWDMPDFVNNIYDEKKFEESVDIIWKKNFHFFNKFVEKTFERELLLLAMKYQAQSHTNVESEMEQEQKMKDDRETHVVFYHHDEKQTLREYNEYENDDEVKHMSEDENLIQLERQQPECGYHVYTIDMALNTSESISLEKVSQLYVCDDDDNVSDFEWAVWKKKTKGSVVNVAKQNRQQTFGYWEILNREKVKKNDLSKKSKGVPIEHLNTIFELLRVYYIKRSVMINKTTDISDHTNDILTDIYCTKYIKQEKVAINIFIHENDPKSGKHTKIHYQLIWWNCKKRTECNAFVIKNVSAYSGKQNIE
eukprot:5860_1